MNKNKCDYSVHVKFTKKTRKRCSTVCENKQRKGEKQRFCTIHKNHFGKEKDFHHEVFGDQNGKIFLKIVMLFLIMNAFIGIFQDFL